jgi:hypothetical protein
MRSELIFRAASHESNPLPDRPSGHTRDTHSALAQHPLADTMNMALVRLNISASMRCRSKVASGNSTKMGCSNSVTVLRRDHDR